MSVIRPLLFGTGRSPHAQRVGGVVVEVVVEVVAQTMLAHSTLHTPGEDRLMSSPRCLMSRRRLFYDRTSVCKFGCVLVSICAAGPSYFVISSYVSLTLLYK